MDLREELGKAIDGETTDAGAESVAQVTETKTEVPAGDPKPAEPAAETGGGDRPRDAQGRFLSKTAEAEPVKTEAQPEPAPGTQETQAEPQGQQQGVDLPPSTWTAAAKAAYASLPDVVRSEIKKRESDFQKGISSYKQAAEFGTRIDQVVRPYLPTIQQAGGQPEQVIKNLLHTAYTLRSGTPQQKQQLLLQVAQEYGVDLGVRPQQTAEQGQFDPNALTPLVQQLLQPVLQRVEQFETRFMTAEQRREAEEQQQYAGQIEAFRTAADEKGQPKHVYFDNVRALMGDLIEKGHANSMEQAYEMACRIHPEVSKAVEGQRTAQAEAQRLAEQKRLAEEARRATTVNAQGQGGVGMADTSKLSLRDELAAQLESARI